MNYFDNRPIGIFDSGVGGLSILRELQKDFANEDFIYIADTGRVPYGDKKPQDIADYTIECFEKLKKLNVKAAILACNASAPYCLDYIKKDFDFPTLGVIGAGILDSAMVTENKNVLIMAATATAKSDVFQKAMHKRDSRVNLGIISCPDLIKAVEDGKGNEEEGYQAAKKYIDEYDDFDYDTVLLACTHLSFAKKSIEKILKDKKKTSKIIDPAKSISNDLNRMLSGLGILSNQEGQKTSYYVTGNIKDFREIAGKLLDQDKDLLDIKDANQI